jgi:uncharacterized protein
MTSTPNTGHILPFTTSLPDTEHFAPAPDRLISGSAAQTVRNIAVSGDGRFNSGVWTSEPGKWRAVYTEDEFCHILEGVVVLHGDDGSKHTFKAGDAFCIKAGFTGTWETVERTKKYYAIYE